MAGSGVESSSDVEKQWPDSTPDQNRHSNVGNRNQVAEAEKGTVSYIAKIALICLFDITIAFYLRFALVCFTGDADYIDEELSDLWRCGRRKNGKECTNPAVQNKAKVGSDAKEGSQGEEGSQMYLPKKVAEARAKKLRDKGLVLATRLGFLAVLWLTINLSVPSLRRATLVGFSLWKWSLFLAITFLGFPVKHFVMKMLLDLAAMTRVFQRSDTQYWIYGLQASAGLVMYFACNLTLWLIFFFTARDELSSKYRTVHKYIILTLVSALVAAFLWLVKSALTLYWMAKCIYWPNKEKILAAGFEFYFLLLLFGQKTPPPELIPDKVVEKILSTEIPGKDNDTPENPDAGMTASRRIERYLSETPVGLQDVDEVAICLGSLAEKFELALTEGIDPIKLDQARTELMKMASPDNPVEGSLKSYLGEDNAKLLLKVLPNLRERSADPHKDCGEWLRDVHSCYLWAHRINGDFELAAILNRVLIGSILVFVGLLWLFITELATAGLIVTMGSLFLGLSFAFGDTCKTFFQGFMFTFVTHPLRVGDRCSIDEWKELGDRILSNLYFMHFINHTGLGFNSLIPSDQLEVKRIKLLTTTLYEIEGGGRTKVLIYPNSDLATKLIIKLQEQPISGSSPRPSLVQSRESGLNQESE